jgi:hypothetical protein
MKKWMLCLIAFAALSPLRAQSLKGTWQGTLQPPQGGKELRIVIKISTTDADTLKAALYSIDQGAQSIAGTSTLQGSATKLSFPGIGGTYEGKLSTDGNSISGTWTQGPPMPLTPDSCYRRDSVDDPGAACPLEANACGCEPGV